MASRFIRMAVVPKRAAWALFAFGMLSAMSGLAAAEGRAFDADTTRAWFNGHLLPDEQVRVMSNTDKLFPSATVSRGGTPSQLPRSKRALGDITIAVGAKMYDLFDYLALNRVAGLLVLKNGEIVYETYQLGLTPNTRWASGSMAKSITSTLVGAALADGHLKSLDDPVTRYLPRLAGSAYDGVTIRQLLQMRSGVAWDETYGDPNSDRRQLLEIHFSQAPGRFLEFMAGLRRQTAPGTTFHYNTGETYLVGAVVAAATGRSLSSYLSEKIWRPLGMEADASWWLLTSGLETGGGGFGATLRDYGRFGQFVLNDGRIAGKPVVRPGWFAEATDSSVNPQYGFQWWLDPPSDDAIHRKSFEAIGVYGQRLYINPQEKLVVVVLSARPKTGGTDVVPDDAFMWAVATDLH
jgi:CubicO group peptidase (beta-lactamase class C family)